MIHDAAFLIQFEIKIWIQIQIKIAYWYFSNISLDGGTKHKKTFNEMTACEDARLKCLLIYSCDRNLQSKWTAWTRDSVKCVWARLGLDSSIRWTANKSVRAGLSWNEKRVLVNLDCHSARAPKPGCLRVNQAHSGRAPTANSIVRLAIKKSNRNQTNPRASLAPCLLKRPCLVIKQSTGGTIGWCFGCCVGVVGKCTYLP